VEEVRELAEKMARNGVSVAVDVQVRVTAGVVFASDLPLQPDAVHDFLAFPSERARGELKKVVVGWVESARRVKYSLYNAQWLIGLMGGPYIPSEITANCRRSDLFASDHVQPRLLQPE